MAPLAEKLTKQSQKMPAGGILKEQEASGASAVMLAIGGSFMSWTVEKSYFMYSFKMGHSVPFFMAVLKTTPNIYRLYVATIMLCFLSLWSGIWMGHGGGGYLCPRILGQAGRD
jgi:hypothetical protein